VAAAKKSGGSNGHNTLTAQMVAVLERIEGEIKGLRGEVREIRDELGEVKAELSAFKTETRTELIQIHHDIADLQVEVHEIRVDLRTGLATQRDHGARIQRLEETVFKRTGT
jgi:predicted RNase H-like nuclease (RuvC/YqgF family)